MSAKTIGMVDVSKWIPAGYEATGEFRTNRIGEIVLSVTGVGGVYVERANYTSLFPMIILKEKKTIKKPKTRLMTHSEIFSLFPNRTIFIRNRLTGVIGNYWRSDFAPQAYEYSVNGGSIWHDLTVEV